MDVIGQAIAIKTGKSENTAESDTKKKEAMEVYVDFLVELLTRPHSIITNATN